jgi:ADP-ribose pyrophosphatase YjhB (NUDIX family)
MGPYRVSKFIEADAAKTADKESVKTKIKQHFVIDAFMSNRDVAVGNFKNIIVDATGTPYRIDNGGSLRYTSVGKFKHGENGYDIYKVTELDSLRDPAINQDGAQVYQLTREEIDQQIYDLLEKKDCIFVVVDDLSTVLDIDDPEGLKNILAHRLKYLEEQRQGPSQIVGAYEEAQPGTSASVLIYTQIPASSEADSSISASLDTYILLGKRVNHHSEAEDVWSNLGGKSDVGTGDDDQLLVDTASREVREESVGLITFTPLQLIHCPSHDLIDKTQNLFHRMYLVSSHFINPEKLKLKVADAKDIHQQEYTDFAWIRLDDEFMKSLEEGRKSDFHIKITKSDGSKATIKLMNNFGEMLSQKQVKDALEKIKERRKIPRLHTRSVVGKETKTLAYKWKQSDDHWVRQYDDERKELALESPASIQDRERADSFIAQAQVRADSLKKIKEKSKKSPVEPAQPAAEIPSSYTFTQTEAFLSLELKGEFKQEEHEQNVDRFFAPVSAYVVDLREFSDILKAVYKNELKKKDWFVFYHAADPSVAFLWDLYTEFRNQLQYTHSTDVRALRGWDEFFKGIEDVSDFITASKIEKLGNDINNYAGDYQERGLAVNFALFGSYGNQTSSTYELFYDSKSVKPPNIEKLLGAFLVKVGAPFSFKNHIWAIKDKYFPDSTNGRLLQIFMNKKALDKVVYLSYPGGKLLSPSDNNANLKAQSMLELLRNKPKDFMNKITAKAIGDKDLQSLQARIFLKPEIMLNPEMVSITSYMRYPLRISKLYQKELKGAVKQLLSYVLEANAAAIDTFSTQQPLLSDYQRYYEMVTGKKLPKGEFATIMQIKKYIDSDDVEGLERLIDAHPKILNTLIPDLEYKYGSQGRLWMPFSYAINKHKVALVIALINKGKGFEAAILAAIEGMKHSAPYVRNAALSLWKVLFKKGQGFEKAIDEATKGIESPEYSVRESALDLWKALFEHRQGFDKATEVAKVGIKSRNDYVWKAVLSLWKALFKFEKDQSFEVALDAAKEGMKIPDYNVRMAALNLWEVLFEKCQGVEDRDFEKQVLNGAIDAATTGMKNLDNDVQSSSSSSLFLWDALLSLWKALVEKDQGFKGAILDASEGMNHPDNYVRMLAFSLWKSLFEKGEGFADAQECLNNMSDTNDFKKGFEQLINEYKSKFEQASLANIVPAASQPAVAAQVPAAK